jgi:hypothetical protein
VLGPIVNVAERAGAELLAVYPLSGHGALCAADGSERRVILRFHAPDLGAVARALKAKGIAVQEPGPDASPCHQLQA